MQTTLRKQHQLYSTVSAFVLVLAGLTTPAHAQFGATSQSSQDLKLAANSPFRDPDIIYLEADVLVNDEENQLLTAEGNVEGRYQDKSLRADSVVYYLSTGKVIAEGNVILLQADGSSQYADKLELSEKLEAGTAKEFVARLPDGGVMAARFVARNQDGEIELFNAYYTACELCENKTNPTWRIKARQVIQDKASRSVQYRDATFELFGLPVFYTPYLSHPDPDATRASGILVPVAGYSSSTGIGARVPYYWAIDDYTEATITPRIYSKVNPLLQYDFARQFHTGRVELNGSVTHGRIFDSSGMAFDDASVFDRPARAPVDKKFRGHLFAKGLFTPTNFWTLGFGLQYTTDDNYLARYDLDPESKTNGLYQIETLRNTSQAFIVGQNDKTRLTVSTVGFEDRRDRILNLGEGQFSFSERNDGRLPFIAPRIEAEHYLTDPILNGRLKASGNLTVFTRETGSDYTRASAALDYGKTWIAPGGIEIKPFANIRQDYYSIKADPDILPGFGQNTFDRTLGQTGVDVRYPFMKLGRDTTWVIEPRVQVTQSFGNAKLEEFVESGASDIILTEDAGNADLTASLLWSSNKSSGFDFWQEGTRIDVGGNLTADWGPANSASVFIGQSFSPNSTGTSIEGLSSDGGGFLTGSGLGGDKSDIIGEATLKFGRKLSAETKLRYDQDTNELTRTDAQVRFSSKLLEGRVRYYKLNSAASSLVDTLDAPPEAINGKVWLNVTKNWSASIAARRDLESNITQAKTFGIRYKDDCTRIDLSYTDSSSINDAIRNNSSFGIRVAFLNLGEFGG